eukprot:GHUV01003100.1.p1 GENE.GHUV01003100.1~~GHUV01003100.1.p1  ORF type:complete len:864 (+),score=393.39 GHUV01003100.1:552-3143(+)
MAEHDGQNDLRSKIMAIMRDSSLTDAEKAQKRQDLMCGGSWCKPKQDAEPGASTKDDKKKQTKVDKAADAKSDLLEDSLKCVICFSLCERPVTGPCQHNFCLNCFKRWTAQGKKNCPTCRTAFPKGFIDNPRINTLLTHAIRCAKQGIKSDAPKSYNRIADDSRPAEAFTTERAVRNGRANAASGRIMVNVPGDWFGPILPEHDSTNGKGVQVGDWWKDRLDCRQWGAHFPHVAGIAGQSSRGAQSVVLSGGYEDDHDEGEWFLYTGSGGRDLSGNKRTNKEQSFDQTFENMNKALKISCLRGLPVRVVRSYKEKRSSYAPSTETPVRYDGIYRILRCWRKKGAQGFLMCRYLFVRCDNAPAPWTSDETGDTIRLDIPDLAAKEIQQAQGQVFEMAENPYWDYNKEAGQWCWAKEQPPSGKVPGGGDAIKKLKKKASAHDRLLKEFSCGLCKGVLDQPLSMPCGHNFCRECLDKRFADLEAAASGGSKALKEAKPARSLRQRKVPKPCPTCKTDIADFMAHAAVNTEMDGLIKRLQEAAEKARQQVEEEAQQLKDGTGSKGEAADAGDDDEADDAEQQEEEQASQDTDEQYADKENQMQEQAPSKKQKLDDTAAAPPAASNGVLSPRQPQATAVAAVPAEQRYAAELAQLRESFPDYDEGLIMGMLDDQGGDLLEVHAALKRMKNQMAHAKRQAARAAAAAADGAAAGSGKGGKGKGRKGTRGKKQTAELATAAEDGGAAAEEQQGGNEGDKGAAVGVPSAAGVAVGETVDVAAADNTAAGGKAAAAAAEQTDTQLESDKSGGAGSGRGGRKAAASKKDQEAVVALKAARTADAEPAAEVAAGGRKRRQAAAAGGGKAAKRGK